MSISTYAELQTAIADFLDRQDLTATIPTFIRLAEARMERDLSHWKQEKRATASYDERYELVPNDMIRITSLMHTDGDPIRVVSSVDMQKSRMAGEDTAGKPVAARLTAGELELWPTPDEAYPVTMLYRAAVPKLSDVTTTNWILTDAPDAYLYGALAQSAPYLKDDARTNLWAALYQSAIDALNLQSKEAVSVGSPRIGVPK